MIGTSPMEIPNNFVSTLIAWNTLESSHLIADHCFGSSVILSLCLSDSVSFVFLLLFFCFYLSLCFRPSVWRSIYLLIWSFFQVE